MRIYQLKNKNKPDEETDHAFLSGLSSEVTMQIGLDIGSTTIKFAVMDDAGLSLSDMLSATDESFLDMETGLMFHDLGRHMPRRDMNVLRLKADGYGTREIAQRENTTVHVVRSILKCAY